MEKKVSLKRIKPTDEALKALSDLYCDEAYFQEDLESLKNEIENNRSMLFIMLIDSACIGYTLCRIDGRDFVVVCSKAKARQDLTKQVLPGFEQLAKQFGCKYMRIHTARKGLIKKLTKQNYKFNEIVMKKEI
jgi:GGDEF domain-containing protein